MSRLLRTDMAIAALAGTAVTVGALGFAGLGERVSNSLFFVACIVTLLVLFVLAIRLPLRGSGSRLSAWATHAGIVSAAIAAVVAVNVAVYRHEVHFDASREGRNTPPSQLTDSIEQLKVPLSLTYFYNAGDPNALAMKDLVEIAARGRPLLSFRAIDLDKEPGLARDLGVRSYNTAVLRAGDRKVLVEHVVDATRLGYAALRVLRERAETMCFITGHGETFRPTPAHFHYSHVETLKGHEAQGAGDILVAEPEKLDRLQLALNQIGFATRGIATTAGDGIPPDCAVVAEIGPRAPFAAGELELLANYLKRGGRLLLLLDPLSPVDAEFEQLLLTPAGLSTIDAIVIDPLNHFRTDPDKVAVPYYPPHPITRRLALTVFPQVRPIRAAKPPAGIAVSLLAASSQDSYLKPPSAAGGIVSADAQATPVVERGAQPLAVALEGSWPGGAREKPFRLVVAGTSKFATNEYFPYVSNGELSLAMMRWLADDEAMPSVAPQTYQLPEIVLTSREMRNTFIALEVLLPLSTALFGVAMWWRRR